MTNWKTCKLSDVVNLISGFAYKSSDWKESGVPVLKITNVRNGRVRLEGCSYITEKLADETINFQIKKGDLLITLTGEIGATGFYSEDFKARLNQRVGRLIPKSDVDVNLRYVAYFLESPMAREIMWSTAKGIAQANISPKEVLGLDIPLPSIDEQHKIVELLEDHLSRLDAALADVKQAKLKAAQFRRSLLQAAFTGNLDAHDSEMETELAEDWRQERFGDIFKVKYGKAIDKSLRMEFAEYPVVGSAGVMTYTKIPLTTEPTIVIGRKGNVGSIQIFKEGCYPIDTTYYMPTISDFDIDFLTFQLTSLELVKLDSSTATPSLRREDLENVQLVVPPMEEQLKIVALLESHLSRLDSMLQLGNVMEKQSAGFRRSLLQAAFTGQLTKEVGSV